jgi:O-acetyl-ADP-ribose deacetylase (regulator of RNase III)
VAFPSISTGAYGYPIDQAAPVALDAVARGLRDAARVQRVTFVLAGGDAMAAFERALRSLTTPAT